jgi:hypothetical protein
MTHRAMQNVIPSFCSNQSVTMRGSAGRFDARRLGPQAIQMFSEALRNLIAVRRNAPPGRFIDVRYPDMMSDPLGEYRKAMEQMGLRVGPADESAAITWMSQNSRDTHPRHRYQATDYGTTEADIAKAFAFYTEALVN